MAERKSVNKYYPPDWDPSKGSINNYVGQHPLRDRAKKLHQGILVIRFEMPYNIWCGGCNAHIGMGVRYNAEKTKTGNYYSTPIYKFRMKCHLCDNYFEIQTDPKNHDYVILEGARRKEQRWDPKENEQIVPEDKATQKKLATDAMFKLEHGTDDRQKGKKAVSSLSHLESSKEGMKDDYILNKMARNKFREEKKALKKIQEDDDALLKKSSLEIPLIEEREADVKLAGLIRLRAVETYDEKQVQKRKEIESRPIFQSKKRARTEDSDSPQVKKFKIITDNIRRAKASSTSSPFDRMKSSMLGVSLTKDQLGIRKKKSNVTKLQEEVCAPTDNEESNLPNEGGNNDLIDSGERDSVQKRIGYEHQRDNANINQEDEHPLSDSKTVDNRSAEIHSDKMSNHNVDINVNVDTRENHGEKLDKESELCVIDKNCKGVKKASTKDIAGCISNEALKISDNNLSEDQLISVDCEKSSYRESDTRPVLSLVAAYSDSEGTDSSED